VSEGGPAPDPGAAAAPPGRKPLRRRLAGYALNVAVLVGVLFLTLGAAELLVRWLAPQQLIQIRPDIWQPADSLGWVNRPMVRTTINTGERTVSLFTDSLGLRVGAAGRRDAPTRVLLIGDSFMQALQVEHEQSTAALLEDTLTRRLGRPVSVWNAAVDGWDPPQYLIRSRQLLDRHAFDLVIVALYLGNDVIERRIQRLPPRQPAERHRFRVRSLRWADLVDGVFYPINDVLEVRSHLYMLAKNGLRPILIMIGLTAEYFPDGLRRREALSPRWDVTADYCLAIARAAAARGAEALFVLLPEPYAVDSSALRELRRGFGVDSADVDVDQPTRLMGEALARRGIEALSVADSFRAAAAGGLRLYGRVDRHLTAQGHAALARLVAPAATAAVGSAKAASPDRGPATRGRTAR
jgi:lysophospholipase L1-like esterase